MKLDSILVAVDFSPLSLAAVERACGLAGERGSVRLLHVVNTELLPHHTFLGRDLVEKFYDGVAAEAEIGLAEMARSFRDKGPTVEREVVRGRPADEIVVAARGLDLVVVGAHARDVGSRLVLGSVAEEVARRSPVPTLDVRETAEGASQVRRVLLAVDVVEPFAEAIDAAGGLASRLGAKLEAIHVVPLPTRLPTTFASKELAKARGDLEAQVRDAAPRAVRKAISQSIGRSAAIHVATGSPAKEIVRYAPERRGRLRHARARRSRKARVRQRGREARATRALPSARRAAGGEERRGKRFERSRCGEQVNARGARGSAIGWAQ